MSSGETPKTTRPKRPRQHINKKRINVAPEPCMYCGKTFALPLSPSNLKTRKYCSVGCAKNGLAPHQKRCETCKRMLPTTTHFKRATTRRGFERRCIECMGDKKHFMRGVKQTRRAPRQMLIIAQKAAAALGVACDITFAQARKLYKEPCFLCGDDTSCMRRRGNTGPYSIGNMQPACFFCTRMLRLFSVNDTVAWAHDIARHNIRLAPRE